MSFGTKSTGDKGTAAWANLVEDALGNGNPAQGAGYTVFLDGSTYKARNGTDGTIDYSGTNPTTVIQAAIDALTAGSVFIKYGGTFTIPSEITGKSNVDIFSDGAILKAQDSFPTDGTNAVLTFSSCENVTVRGLRVDGNKAGNPNPSDVAANRMQCIRLDGTSKKINVLNCKVYDANDTNVALVDTYGTVSNCLFEGNEIYGADQNVGLWMQYGFANIAQGNIVRDNGTVGVHLWGSERTQVLGNQIYGNGHLGIDIDGDVDLSKPSHHAIVANNIIYDNGASGATHYSILIEAGSANCVIDNNIIRGNSVSQIGVYVQYADNIISNNFIEDMITDGILSSSSGNVIKGNICRDNAESGIHLYTSSCLRNIVIGNSCLSNTQYGIEGESSDYELVLGNVAVGNTAGQISGLGANKVEQHNITA